MTLRELRTELVETVTGVTTYDHVPARAVTPAAFIVPGSPYITAGQTFGIRTVRFGLVLLTTPSMNRYETDALDQQIEKIQHDLESAGWLVESVNAPEIQDLNGAEILATTINVATDATFN